jgi:hypothetical protein
MAVDFSSLASGAAGATPYGAAIGAAGSVLTSALTDKPSNTTSGAGAYQAGPFVVGSKQVGGKGNSAGATTASASQTPDASSADAATSAKSQTTLYVVLGIVASVITIVIFLTGNRRSRS